MQELINNVVLNLEEIIFSVPPIIGLLLGMIIIILESIIPILPLAVFIAVNMILFGNFFGFILSWTSTIIGCLIMFTLVRKYLSNHFRNYTKRSKQIKKIMEKFDHIKFPTLVLITALPFTPAFLINIAAGLSKMSYKKFTANILIAKLSIVYFWGYIGTSFIESITDITVLIRLTFIMLGAYVLSKIVMKKNKID